MTMIMATHEMQFCREIADQVCFLDAGRIAGAGTPDEVFGDPDGAAHPRVPEPRLWRESSARMDPAGTRPLAPLDVEETTVKLDPVLLEILVCPDCKGSLTVDHDQRRADLQRVRADLPGARRHPGDARRRGAAGRRRAERRRDTPMPAGDRPVASEATPTVRCPIVFDDARLDDPDVLAACRRAAAPAGRGGRPGPDRGRRGGRGWRRALERDDRSARRRRGGCRRPAAARRARAVVPGAVRRLAGPEPARLGRRARPRGRARARRRRRPHRLGGARGGTPRLQPDHRLPAALGARRARRRAGTARCCPTQTDDTLAVAVVMLQALHHLGVGPEVDADEVARVLDDVAIACSPRPRHRRQPGQGPRARARRLARRSSGAARCSPPARPAGSPRRSGVPPDGRRWPPTPTTCCRCSRRHAPATCSPTRSPTTERARRSPGPAGPRRRHRGGVDPRAARPADRRGRAPTTSACRSIRPSRGLRDGPLRCVAQHRACTPPPTSGIGLARDDPKASTLVSTEDSPKAIIAALLANLGHRGDEAHRLRSSPVRRRCWPSRSTRWPTRATRCCCSSAAERASAPGDARTTRSGSAASATSTRSSSRSCCSASAACSRCTRRTTSATRSTTVIRTSCSRATGGGSPSSCCVVAIVMESFSFRTAIVESNHVRGDARLDGVHPSARRRPSSRSCCWRTSPRSSAWSSPCSASG